MAAANAAADTAAAAARLRPRPWHGRGHGTAAAAARCGRAPSSTKAPRVPHLKKEKNFCSRFGRVRNFDFLVVFLPFLIVKKFALILYVLNNSLRFEKSD